MNSGWICPRCSKCYSPTTPQCFTCGQPTYTSNQTDWTKAAKSNLASSIDIGHGCRNIMNCERKDGYCAKCHSEYY